MIFDQRLHIHLGAKVDFRTVTRYPFRPTGANEAIIGKKYFKISKYLKQKFRM
jgi:hypothetical protein